MTNLNKPVTRVTGLRAYEQSKSREIVVSLEPPGILGFRLKGTRRVYRLPVDACYHTAIKAELAFEAREKKKSKKKGSR